MQTEMLTGNTAQTAAAVARQLRIDTVIAEMRPEDKTRESRELQGEGRKVGMIGDGVNHAPALADSWLAIGAGRRNRRRGAGEQRTGQCRPDHHDGSLGARNDRAEPLLSHDLHPARHPLYHRLPVSGVRHPAAALIGGTADECLDRHRQRVADWPGWCPAEPLKALSS